MQADADARGGADGAPRLLVLLSAPATGRGRRPLRYPACRMWPTRVNSYAGGPIRLIVTGECVRCRTYIQLSRWQCGPLYVMWLAHEPYAWPSAAWWRARSA